MRLPSIVSVYNQVATFLSYVGKPFPQSVKETCKFAARSINGADELKTFFIKPLTLLGLYYDRYKREGGDSFIKHIGDDALQVKNLMNALECIGTLPRMLAVLSQPVEESQRIRWFMSLDKGFVCTDKPQFSKREVLFKRITFLANGMISIAHAARFVKKYRSIPSSLELIFWMEPFAGGYAGAQSLWEELRLACAVWWGPNYQVHVVEKVYGFFNLATHSVTLFASITAGLELRYGKGSSQGPDCLSKWQLIAEVGSVVAPFFQQAMDKWMDIQFPERGKWNKELRKQNELDGF